MGVVGMRMGVRNWWRDLQTPKIEERDDTTLPLTFDQYVGWFNYQSHQYPFPMLNQTLSGREDRSGEGFAGLIQGTYRSNAIVFACMAARQMIFSQARLQFRQMRNGRPGDLFGTQELALLERPWPGGTTGDLLSHMIQDVDISGNAYIVRQPGRLHRLRPDWVTIVMGSPNDPDMDMWDVNAELLGYIYRPQSGSGTTRKPEIFLANEVAHFAPHKDPTSPYRGMSWLMPIMREIMGDSAATTHKLKFFENGATPNMVITVDPQVQEEEFKRWRVAMEQKHEGVWNAYKTLYLGGGASKVDVVGANLRQIDFKTTQGAGETRIIMAAGLHAVVLGSSEGLQGSSLNVGNFSAARRSVADRTFHPLWQNVSSSLAQIINVPPGADLWYDVEGVPFLSEDVMDAAQVQQTNANTIRQLLEAGFTASSAIAAVAAQDMTLLKHTGLFSVQLQAPGSLKMPVGEVPGELPVGPGTAPEKVPSGIVPAGDKPQTPPKAVPAFDTGNGKAKAPVKP